MAVRELVVQFVLILLIGSMGALLVWLMGAPSNQAVGALIGLGIGAAAILVSGPLAERLTRRRA